MDRLFFWYYFINDAETIMATAVSMLVILIWVTGAWTVRGSFFERSTPPATCLSASFSMIQSHRIALQRGTYALQPAFAGHTPDIYDQSIP